ncbi:MAG: ABC transporter substrate-binding protein, partial [Hyphomicrobiaceae bacterium]
MRTPSRRDVLLAAGSAGLALTAGGRNVLAQSAGQLTVVSFGGSYQEGQSKALFQPAAKALG